MQIFSEDEQDPENEKSYPVLPSAGVGWEFKFSMLKKNTAESEATDGVTSI